MDVKYFKYVLEIYKCGSINKAATNLFITQSNLSASIKGLEEQLGFSIFTRHNLGIKLTPEGELFLLSAKNIILELETIERIPQKFQLDRNLSISCTYSSTFMESFMEFKAGHGANEFDDKFKETGLIQTIQDVIEKKYKLSLFYCFDSRYHEHFKIIEKYNLDIIHICSNLNPRVLVSSSGKYNNKNTIDIDEIRNEEFVTYENFHYQDWLEVLGRDKNLKTLYIFDRGGLVDSVLYGNYISVVMGEISKEQKLSGCKTLEITGFNQKLSVFLVSQKNYKLNIRERKFLKILKHNLLKI